MSYTIKKIFEDFPEQSLDEYLKTIEPNNNYETLKNKRYMSIYYLYQNGQLIIDSHMTDINFWNYLLLSETYPKFEYFYQQNPNLNNLWDMSSYKQYKPRILLGFYNNKILATVSDNTAVYRFVSENKNKKNTDGIIYTAVSSKCESKYVPRLGYVWEINDSEQDIKMNKSALQVISCTANDTNISTWLNKNKETVPYVYDLNFDNWVKTSLSSRIPKNI